MDPNQSASSGGGDICDLINSFNCLGTNDKNDLVQQFLACATETPHVAKFYLEAYNWNLQIALDVYMEHAQDPQAEVKAILDQALSRIDADEEFDEEIHSEIGEEVKIGEDVLELINMLPPGPITVLPSTQFQVTWQLYSKTSAQLPPGTQIVRTNGTYLGKEKAWMFPNEIQPETICEVTVDLISPPAQGNFRTEWHVVTPDGLHYGQKIFTDVIVVDNVPENGMDENNNILVGPTPRIESWMQQYPQQFGPGDELDLNNNII